METLTELWLKPSTKSTLFFMWSCFHSVTSLDRYMWEVLTSSCSLNMQPVFFLITYIHFFPRTLLFNRFGIFQSLLSYFTEQSDIHDAKCVFSQKQCGTINLHPYPPLYCVTSDLLKQLWKHICSLWLSLFLCSSFVFPPMHSLQAGTNGCFGTLCECVCVCSVGWCLIVLCVINCCDSRNVCVTSARQLESISFLFWVSLACYHSNTRTHTQTHTQTQK